MDNYQQYMNNINENENEEEDNLIISDSNLNEEEEQQYEQTIYYYDNTQNDDYNDSNNENVKDSENQLNENNLTSNFDTQQQINNEQIQEDEESSNEGEYAYQNTNEIDDLITNNEEESSTSSNSSKEEKQEDETSDYNDFYSNYELNQIENEDIPRDYDQKQNSIESTKFQVKNSHVNNEKINETELSDDSEETDQYYDESDYNISDNDYKINEDSNNKIELENIFQDYQDVIDPKSLYNPSNFTAYLFPHVFINQEEIQNELVPTPFYMKKFYFTNNYFYLFDQEQQQFSYSKIVLSNNSQDITNISLPSANSCVIIDDFLVFTTYSDNLLHYLYLPDNTIEFFEMLPFDFDEDSLKLIYNDYNQNSSFLLSKSTGNLYLIDFLVLNEKDFHKLIWNELKLFTTDVISAKTSNHYVIVKQFNDTITLFTQKKFVKSFLIWSFSTKNLHHFYITDESFIILQQNAHKTNQEVSIYNLLSPNFENPAFHNSVKECYCTPNNFYLLSIGEDGIYSANNAEFIFQNTPNIYQFCEKKYPTTIIFDENNNQLIAKTKPKINIFDQKPLQLHVNEIITKIKQNPLLSLKLNIPKNPNTIFQEYFKSQKANLFSHIIQKYNNNQLIESYSEALSIVNNNDFLDIIFNHLQIEKNVENGFDFSYLTPNYLIRLSELIQINKNVRVLLQNMMLNVKEQDLKTDIYKRVGEIILKNTIEEMKVNTYPELRYIANFAIAFMTKGKK